MNHFTVSSTPTSSRPTGARPSRHGNDVWGDYSGPDLQCDEYPFASTKERGADNFRYSARLIDGPDNKGGGRRLNSMYTANRILDGDAFYVTVVP
ncbi:NucA/NucB deoxyribonuclease domain-containing protein [Streptomyces sp. NPDC047860]|uniref:NucA/NucB deoxyribonuclease domain-containing protein n=1 Tax=Streptomyces sp. NPDC047860 TaxID=3155743 RepID=UPI0033F0C745